MNEKEPSEENLVPDHSSSVLAFNIRLSFYVSKLSSLLNSIQLHVVEPRNVELIDDDVLKRERRMAGEFERRFSRINLYSLHLKLKRLEKLIIVFRSSHASNVPPSSILRTVVLSVFKNLTNSLQTYTKFIRKMKISVCSKLRELLNYISHTYYTVHYVVDHDILELYDLPALSRIVLTTVDYKIISSNEKNEIDIRRKKRAFRGNKPTPRDHFVRSNDENKCGSGNGKKKDKKNVTFELCECELRTNVMKTSVDLTGNSQNEEAKIPFRKRLSTTTIRLCDRVTDNLMKEMVEDITESVHCIVIESFDREFYELN